MMNNTQTERYARQLMLPGIGREGQEKLLNSRVLVIGCGGLGCPASLYLAGAGVGTIGLMDTDRVKLSNLHRQIGHTLLDINRPKTESLAQKLRIRNSDIEVRADHRLFSPANALEILDEYDVAVDCTDTFEAKFLIADACHLAGKPYSHAGVTEYRGQAMTVRPGLSTCYRCIFDPPPRNLPAPSQQGIFGPVAAILGSIQAAEILKLLLGHGSLLANRLLTVDTSTMRMRDVPFKRRTACPLCGAEATIQDLNHFPAPTPSHGCCCGGGGCDRSAPTE